MEFLIADTFTDSLGRLTGDEQKAVKTTAFDLQVDPSRPGMKFHRLDKAKDRNFWSVRVNRDVRVIVHKTDDRMLLCYVDHHDRAYAWAERRRLEVHPRTGAAQLVEIRERIEEIAIPVYVESEQPSPQRTLGPLLASVSDDVLLSHGVPSDWLEDVKAADEETLLAVVERLPAEAAEAVLELATGGTPKAPEPATEEEGPFTHPDAQRRFRIVTGIEELQAALEYPWEKWTVFLHPEQRSWVAKDHAGPARVSGSAGTGKTIVALHRAVHLARANPDARVLLTTFSDTLSSALRTKLQRLLVGEPRLGERIDVSSIDAVGVRLFRAHIGPVQPASDTQIRDAISKAAAAVPDHGFTMRFLLAEWEQIVDAWQLIGWEAYREVARLGRKTRLSEARREVLWRIFEQVRDDLDSQGVITAARMFTHLAEVLAAKPPVFQHVVVDEAQDVSVAQLKFLAAIGGGGPNGLFFAGDLGQRIFQQPFSWLSLGVDIRGRSKTLRVNYRTSHQIRTHADRLLGPQVADIDGNIEDRSHTVSVFNGPPPVIETFDGAEGESAAVGARLAAWTAEGIQPNEIAVFVRSDEQIPRAQAAVTASGLDAQILDERVATATGKVSISTMHLAKGLEFRAVVVMACDDEILPLQERIEAVGDDADLEEIYNTERHLLYVACTRARDHLYVTGIDPASEFLADLGDS